MIRRAALLGIVLLGLVGCGGGTGEPRGTVVPARTPTPTHTPTAVPTLPPAQPHGLAPTPTSAPIPSPTGIPISAYIGVSHEGGTLGDIWHLADIRMGLHPNRVRVVWEMQEARASAPHFTVVEVDNALTPFPSGPGGQTTYDPSWGQARLDIVVSDLYAIGFPLQERLPLVAPENPVVTRVGLYPTYDDALMGFSIGLKHPAPYEVTTLTEPVRIVIDVLY
ncbi:MAG: hypothetical protein ACE5MB_04105 [Anaerolineae bacterium]